MRGHAADKLLLGHDTPVLGGRGEVLERPTGHFEGTYFGPANGWVRPIRDVAPTPYSVFTADGSIAKDAEPLRSTMKESATSALTNSAFSWKFGSEVPEDVAWIDERFVRVRQCSGGGLSRAHEAIL